MSISRMAVFAAIAVLAPTTAFAQEMVISCTGAQKYIGPITGVPLDTTMTTNSYTIVGNSIKGMQCTGDQYQILCHSNYIITPEMQKDGMLYIRRFLKLSRTSGIISDDWTTGRTIESILKKEPLLRGSLRGVSEYKDNQTFTGNCKKASPKF